ncbi:putative nucleotidyltransferase with HDIG domain [Amycolatopsis bartoniae]|uniref:Metal-dependent phosphohydrolase, HD subdomain protein n=1 Tax=Amycolatopsis bartoniae TaxID=941986 RepID=A0A8H9M5Z6_9PSEU|nr:HD domain-containing protein [Amycolatopsis bartoniae]MBB2935671.1 putative nucleotidyltransferase with HDIG domain [Amycolatopsis bartoniae]TVT02317.1 HD domain-containing protein [Amycolatopsis bartoniae]GHF61011.1 metal-dependent phosphohydrolase, HD subdomain protein [Amycolatopsis bartoniae]
MSLVSWAHDIAARKLADSLPRRWAHVQGVARQARRLQSVPGLDAELVEVAALLHDVGYAPDLATLNFHPIDGARYLASIGTPSRLVNLVAHHSAAYQDAEVVGLTHLLADYEDEQTPERDALWWADMTTGPDGETLTFIERMTEVKERYGPEHAVSKAIDLSWPERLRAVERTEARLAAHVKNAD